MILSRVSFHDNDNIIMMHIVDNNGDCCGVTSAAVIVDSYILVFCFTCTINVYNVHNSLHNIIIIILSDSFCLKKLLTFLKIHNMYILFFYGFSFFFLSRYETIFLNHYYGNNKCSSIKEQWSPGIYVYVYILITPPMTYYTVRHNIKLQPDARRIFTIAAVYFVV